MTKKLQLKIEKDFKFKKLNLKDIILQKISVSIFVQGVFFDRFSVFPYLIIDEPFLIWLKLINIVHHLGLKNRNTCRTWLTTVGLLWHSRVWLIAPTRFRNLNPDAILFVRHRFKIDLQPFWCRLLLIIIRFSNYQSQYFIYRFINFANFVLNLIYILYLRSNTSLFFFNFISFLGDYFIITARVLRLQILTFILIFWLRVFRCLPWEQIILHPWVRPILI